jgi:hypothetical protein
MEKKILFAAWFLLTLITTATILLLRRKKQIAPWALPLTDVMRIMFGIFTFLSGCFLGYKIATEFDQLEPIVGGEGLVSMCIGILASSWFSVVEVSNLIRKSPTHP